MKQPILESFLWVKYCTKCISQLCHLVPQRVNVFLWAVSSLIKRINELLGSPGTVVQIMHCTTLGNAVFVHYIVNCTFQNYAVYKLHNCTQKTCDSHQSLMYKSFGVRIGSRIQCHLQLDDLGQVNFFVSNSLYVKWEL